MKKNKLVELLNAIPGNPDVLLWNGYVEDYQDLNPKFLVTELVKEDKAHLRDLIRYERIRDNLPPLTDAEVEIELKEWMKTREWEFPNEHLTDEQNKRWYGKNRKKIVLIERKLRGKNSWDRMGSMDY